MGDTTDELCSAILEKRVVALRGKDDRGDRIVEPHVVYEAPNGNVLIDFYQTAGYSSTGSLPSWRRLKIGDIVSLQTLSERFEIRVSEGYNPLNRKRYFRTVCQA